LARFHTSDDLYEYLRQTHPPQRPGALTEADYRNVTALLWQSNGRSTLTADQPAAGRVLPIVIGLLLLALAIFATIEWIKRKQHA
jgi:hypothetical protein